MLKRGVNPAYPFDVSETLPGLSLRSVALLAYLSLVESSISKLSPVQPSKVKQRTETYVPHQGIHPRNSPYVLQPPR